MMFADTKPLRQTLTQEQSFRKKTPNCGCYYNHYHLHHYHFHHCHYHHHHHHPNQLSVGGIGCLTGRECEGGGGREREGGREECEGGSWREWIGGGVRGLTTWLLSALSSPARSVQHGQSASEVRKAPSCRISQRGHRPARARREIYELWRASLE